MGCCCGPSVPPDDTKPWCICCCSANLPDLSGSYDPRCKPPKFMMWQLGIEGEMRFWYRAGIGVNNRPQCPAEEFVPPCDLCALLSGTWTIPRNDTHYDGTGGADDLFCADIEEEPPCTVMSCVYHENFDYDSTPASCVIETHGEGEFENYFVGEELWITSLHGEFTCDFANNKMKATVNIGWSRGVPPTGANSGSMGADFEAPVADWTTLTCSGLGGLTWTDVSHYADSPECAGFPPGVRIHAATENFGLTGGYTLGCWVEAPADDHITNSLSF